MAVPADTGPYWEKIVGPGAMPVRLPSCCGPDWTDARGIEQVGNVVQGEKVTPQVRLWPEMPLPCGNAAPGPLWGVCNGYMLQKFRLPLA